MDDPHAILQLGLKHLAKGENIRAARILKDLSREHPDIASVQEALGRSYYGLGLYFLAAQQFEKMVEHCPVEDYAHYVLGRSYERLGSKDLALRHYRLARALNPTNPYYSLSLDLMLWHSA